MTTKKLAPRAIRKLRVRKKIYGTPERPRISVFRSGKNMSAQIIDDDSGKTLVAASTVEKEFRAKIATATKEGAKIVGALLAERALAKGISAVVFDRSGYRFHGRVRALADAAREKGLKF